MNLPYTTKVLRCTDECLRDTTIEGLIRSILSIHPTLAKDVMGYAVPGVAFFTYFDKTASPQLIQSYCSPAENPTKDPRLYLWTVIEKDGPYYVAKFVDKEYIDLVK